MNIRQITDNKKQYLDLLLLADPQEDMIDRYLDEGEMFVLEDGGEVRTVCVVQPGKNRQCELKNIATEPESQGKGYGRQMIRFICEHYSGSCDTMYVGTGNCRKTIGFYTMYVGTGNCRKTIGFYEKCGFVNSHIVANFFVDHYQEPIYEDGIRLVDMVYLKKRLESEVDVKKVVDLALEAGRILLKNGAEIFRVEETITRICQRFHVDHVDIFTLSHAIFVSAENGMEEAYTKVKHIPLSSAHLGIVAEVNDLSREIAAGRVTMEEASSASLGFLLGSTVTESGVAFLIGCLLYVWVLTAKRHHMSKIIVNLVGGVVITALALLARQIPFWETLRLEGMISGAIMPLVPGMAFVNAIRDIADSDFLSGTVRMIDALLVFVYIAIGVGITLSLYNNMMGGVIL